MVGALTLLLVPVFQLVAAKGELAMAKEQNELDSFELREENSSLKKQIKKAKSALQTVGVRVEGGRFSLPFI